MFLDRKKPTVLLVEDNAVAQKIHTYFLKKLGLAINLATNGEQALQATTKEEYFAIILDLGLPDMDGESVITKIHAQESLINRCTPIIIVTAHGDEKILSRFKKSEQATDVFTKPVTFSKLKHALDKIKLIKEQSVF